MGILKAVAGAISGGLADSWLDVVEPYEMTDQTIITKGVQVNNKRSSNKKGTDNIISNGSIIHVGQNQMMLLVDGGKVIDYSAEPGNYEVYLSSTPSMFNGELGDSIRETFSRIKFGGQPSASQQVFFVNLQEIRGIKFGTPNALQYFDKKYNAELFLRCHGKYSIKITDPLKFYTEVAPRANGKVEIDDINSQFQAEFLSSLQRTITKMSVKGVDIGQIMAYSDDMQKQMNVELDGSWKELRGMEIVSVAIENTSYDEDSKKLIHMRNQGAMLSDPTVREGYVQGSIARGLEAAGSNQGGAATAFMGMGMGMNSAGGFMSAASQTNAMQMQQQQIAAQQPISSQSLSAGAWECACGQLNSGNFCSGCGKAKPAPAGGWTCECGATSTGKFCGNCGKPQPAASNGWTCECGNVCESAFCSKCGAKKPE